MVRQDCSKGPHRADKSSHYINKKNERVSEEGGLRWTVIRVGESRQLHDRESCQQGSKSCSSQVVNCDELNGMLR